MRFVTLTAISLAMGGCAAGADATCALDTSATYTVTVVPDGRPQVGTLGGLLGGCELEANKQWAATCAGERLTYTCGDARFTYTVRDASGDGYSVVLANEAQSRDTALTLHVVEGGTSE
jgi:hypothetical protein